QWLPNEYGGKENLSAIAFLRQLNSAVGALVPGAVTIAEESTSWPGVTRPVHLGGLGFWFKWNMGWMHDTLDYLRHEAIYRQYHHQQVTFSMMYAYAENFVLPLSHDEVVHGKGSLLRKMPGDRWNELAGLRALLAYQWAHPGKQLLFMGGELGQESEWAEGRELDWWLLEHSDHAGVQRLVGDLNRLYRATPALWRLDHDPRGFQWIDANDAEGNVLSFLRMDDDGRELACVVNFAGVPHEGYRLGLPRHGRWREVLNTDAGIYGGSGVGNLGEVRAIPEPYHSQPASVALRLPPLGALWLAQY
ncbi:MAG: alpha amylase C-terminal domain-containing protein, partial [Mycobacteriales bacterium]